MPPTILPIDRPRAERRLRAALRIVARTPPARAMVSLLEKLATSPAGSFAVLTYHRVGDPDASDGLYAPLVSASPDGFEAQMQMLVSRFHPIALADVVAAFRGEAELPPRAVLVTFDDAYRDFQHNAWPVMRRLGIPAALFVPTAYPADPTRAFWWDRLWASIVRSPAGTVIDTPRGRQTLRSAAQRKQLAIALVQHHKTLAHETAMRSIDAICERLAEQPLPSSVMSWDELRAAAAEGVSLAAHSRTHPLLTRIGEAALRGEIEGARDDLASNVPDHPNGLVFGYPGGSHNGHIERVVREHGYEVAFTTTWGINRVGRTDPFALRRMNVGAQSDGNLIRAQLVVGAFGHRFVTL